MNKARTDRGPRFRLANAQDAPVVGPLLAALGYTAPDEDTLVRVLRDAADIPGLHVVLMEHGDPARVVGLATLSIRPQLRLGAPLATLDEFVVAEGERGAGLGGAFLRELETRAVAIGAVRMELHTRRTRESYVRGFYAKHGYEEADCAVLRRSLP
jgi:GNAT superfamily N-acetyltransferase